MPLDAQDTSQEEAQENCVPLGKWINRGKESFIFIMFSLNYVVVVVFPTVNI